MDKINPEAEVQPNEEECEEDDHESLPVVLQCSHCNVILGDSMSWVSTNDDLKSVTLHSVSSMVVQGKQLVTSTEGIDLGSTYLQLQCKSCKNVIGRIYKTTAKTLDELRGLYTLSISKVNSYQVGSMEQSAGKGDSLDIPSATELKASIMKTQVMVFTLNERVLNIENAMQMEGDEDEDTLKNDEAVETEDTHANSAELNNNKRDSDCESDDAVDTVVLSSQRNKLPDGVSKEDRVDQGKNLQEPAGKRGKPKSTGNASKSKRIRYK